MTTYAEAASSALKEPKNSSNEAAGNPGKPVGGPSDGAKGEVHGSLDKGSEKSSDYGELPKKCWKTAVSIIQEAVVKLKEQSRKANSSLSNYYSKAITITGENIKEPVILSWSLTSIASIIGGICLYTERHRINTSNRVVMSMHAGILTGFLLLQAMFFKKIYPKYEK